MKVFISWSGSISHNIAKVFRDWLPTVIQATKPYLSSEDIYKGTRWFDEISGELAETAVGIIILTRQSMNEPWVHFEAGALSKSLDKSRVCPVLFGISTTDIKGPLTQFQSTPFDKDEIFKLLKTINQALGESKLDNDTLREVFDTFWPKLEEKVRQKMETGEDGTESQEIREDRELLEEILNITRSLASSHRVHRIPTIHDLPDDWRRRLIDAVELRAPEIAETLEEANAITIDLDDQLHIYFEDDSATMLLGDPFTRSLIEDEVGRLFGLLVRCSFAIRKKT